MNISQEDPLLESNYIIEETLEKTSNRSILICRNLIIENKLSLIQAYTFDYLDEEIRIKIIDELSKYWQLKQSQMSCIENIYIFSKENKINLMIQYHHPKSSKTLRQLIQSGNFTVSKDSLIKQLKSIVERIQKLHQKKLIHNNIKLSNIFYNGQDDSLVIGPPLLPQIEKYCKIFDKRENQTHSIYNSPEVLLGQSFSLANDIWQLGVVSLQMILNESLEIKYKDFPLNIQQQFSKINNQKLGYLCKKMLEKNPQQRVNIDQVLQILDGIQSIQSLIHVEQTQPAFNFITISLSSTNPQNTLQFHHRIKKQQSAEKSLFQFSFTRKQDSYQLCLKLPTNQTIVKQIKTLTLSSQLKRQLSRFHQSFQKSNTSIELSQTGTLSLIYPTQSEKPLIVNQNFTKTHVGNIISPDKTISRGIIIQPTIILCTMNKLFDEKLGKQFKYLQFSFNEGTNKKKQLNFCQGYIEDRSPNNSYSVMELQSKVQKSSRTYLRFIKNYSQTAIERITNSSEQKIYYNYQIGEIPLAIQEVQFYEAEKYFKIKAHNEILPGQPLRINFSNRNEAVIGLYAENGIGILFDDNFYWKIYELIANLNQKQTFARIQLPFFIVQCNSFLFQKENIINLNDSHYKLYLLEHNIKTFDQLLIQITSLLQINEENSQIAFLKFHLRDMYLRNKQYKNAIQICLNADQILKNVYKTPINAVVISYLLANGLYGIFKQQLSVPLRQQLCFYMQKCIKLLQQYQFNPILLSSTLYMAALCLSDYNESITYHKRSRKLCKKLNFFPLLRRNYMAIMRDYKLPTQQMENYYQQYEHLRYQNCIDQSQQGQFRRLIDKIELFKQAKQYQIVNKILLALSSLHHEHFRPHFDKFKQLREIWKSILLQLMKSENNLEILLEFQQTSQKYYGEDYIHAKDSFRQKKRLITEQANRFPFA